MSHRRAFGMIIAMSAVLGGCGHHATGQTVAVVNGEEISAAELNAELAQAQIPPSADKKAITAQLLQNIINRRLLTQRASEQGIDKTPEFLTQQRRLNEELLISLSAKRQMDVTKLPTPAAVDAFIAANPGMFRDRATLSLQQIQFDAPTSADAINQLKGDHSMEAVAATLTALRIPFTRADTKVDTAKVPPTALRQVDALPAGEPFIVPANGRMIASVVTSREPIATTPDDNRKIAVDTMRRQSALEATQNLVKQLRTSAKIEYQPGYAPQAAAGNAAPAS